MVYRLYVEKKPGLDNDAKSLLSDIRTNLEINSLENIRLLNRYDVENIDADLFETCKNTVFSEPQLDNVYAELPKCDGVVFGVEFLPGQYDQRADSAAQCVQIIGRCDRPEVKTAKIYILIGALSEDEINAIKSYVINPVESRIASLETKSTLKTEYSIPTTVETLDGFIDLDKAGLKICPCYGLC